MTEDSRPRKEGLGRRSTKKPPPIFPKATTDRTDRLVTLSDHCDAAKKIAEGMDEAFLAFLLSMVIEEARTAMRRATLAAPLPQAKPRARKRGSPGTAAAPS